MGQIHDLRATQQMHPPAHYIAVLWVPKNFPAWALIEVAKQLPEDAELMPNHTVQRDEGNWLGFHFTSAHFRRPADGESLEINLKTYRQIAPGSFLVELEAPYPRETG